MKIEVTVSKVQTPRGSCNKYAFGAYRLIATVGTGKTIIDNTSRLLTWQSGNWSRYAKPIVENFTKVWDKTTIEIEEAIKIAEGRAKRPRGIRALRQQLVDSY